MFKDEKMRQIRAGQHGLLLLIFFSKCVAKWYPAYKMILIALLSIRISLFDNVDCRLQDFVVIPCAYPGNFYRVLFQIFAL